MIGRIYDLWNIWKYINAKARMKIAVVGTGIAGLSVARMLQKEHDVVLFEKSDKIGGLIKCDRVKDCLYHKVGGHVFNSRNTKVLNWFWSQFNRDAEFLQADRNAKILFRNKIIGYPIENYLYLLEKPLTTKILQELVALGEAPKLSPFEFHNFESFLRNNFGNTLFEIYFGPYNRKIWQTDLGNVAMDWLEGKLPMPNLVEIILSNIFKEEEATMVHANFFYAKENGSQFIVDRLAKGLNIYTNVSVDDTTISRQGETFTIGEQKGFDRIIYCGDVRTLPSDWKESLQRKGVDVSYLEGIRSNGTSTLFCETDDTDISWLYIPEDFTKAHRIIYTGNFSPSNNRGSERKTCVVEFSGNVDYDTMIEEVKKLPGNLLPLAFNYEANSYVVQDQRTRTEIAAAKKVLETMGIFLLGRFAEWEYYNMDKAIEAAFDVAGKFNVAIAT
ncbi:MAG TPA: NAD(P)-binding protein [Chitinophagaceae bacterium]|nr:NAD(P)-binding protein [Chitinophagaceae bacterium]